MCVILCCYAFEKNAALKSSEAIQNHSLSLPLSLSHPQWTVAMPPSLKRASLTASPRVWKLTPLLRFPSLLPLHLSVVAFDVVNNLVKQ